MERSEERAQRNAVLLKRLVGLWNGPSARLLLGIDLPRLPRPVDLFLRHQF